MASNDALRSKEMAAKYRAHKATGALEKSCPLCDAGELQGFKLWKIIPNDFPYDLFAATHHMIVPMRHVTEKELTEEELKELQELKYSVMQEYDIIVEATSKSKSIPAHFHLHLIHTKRVEI